MTASPVGSSATPAGGATLRPASRDAGVVKVDAGDVVIRGLILAVVVSLFIPEGIAVMAGSVKVTPAFAFSIVLFPLLLVFGKIRWCWVDVVILSMFAVFFFSFARSGPVTAAIESTGRAGLTAMVPMMIGRYIVQDLRMLKRVLTLLVIGVGVFSLFSIFESVFRWNIHSVFWQVPYEPHKQIRLGFTRAHAWTSHAIMFGLVCASFVPMLAVAIRERWQLFGRWPTIKALAVAVGCFFSISTSAWIVAVLALGLVCWDYVCKVRPSIRWCVSFVTVVGGYAFLELASERALLRVLMMRMHLTSPTAWWYRWRLYERVFAEMPGHWWLGHGMATPAAFQGFQSSIDNHYLVVLLNHGRMGLILWIGVLVCAIAYGGAAVWARTDSPFIRLTRAFSFALIGIALTLLNVALFSTPMILYWMFIGIFIGAAQRCRKEPILRGEQPPSATPAPPGRRRQRLGTSGPKRQGGRLPPRVPAT